MNKFLKLFGVLLVMAGFLGILGGASAHAATLTPLTQHHPQHHPVPLTSCKDEDGVEVTTTSGYECLTKGSQGFFFHVNEIHNYTDVTIRFFDRTLSETFKIAPGEEKTFDNDQGILYVPVN